MTKDVLEKIKASGLKLLVADDEGIICQSLKMMGEMMGLEVHAAADGNEAWDIFKLIQPDIAILDIYMPHMDGLTLLRKMKEINHTIPIILITGYAQYEQLVLKNDIKPDGFITKPFTLEVIVKELIKLAYKVELVA